ncbi:uncharacterized protein OCT59_012140 [Rhizophagus irregularis]|uniref:uncharacterized protein n=1 Tax=Rhizophagus irregularis TaxID=588596 RepID=UPI00331763FD|nr:hypothetical protein OCT59_012140 [Rhizophagus irregularis]
MSKKKQYIVTLLAKGIISEDLHYGIYARNWWEPCKFNENCINPIPYRLFMSVNCCLNGKNFAITVINDEQTHNPCFHCICDGKDSGTQLTATAAINNTYSQIFSNKTKYSGLAVMGFDNEVIVREQTFAFVQCIEDECSLDIYNEGIKLYHNKDTTPNKIWETIGILKKYDGATLFGITDYNIQQILTELNKLEKSKNLITCTSDNWKNIDILNFIFEQNIKKRKIANTFSSWSKLFTNWYDQTNTIIQFPTILYQIYPKNYQFQEKELGAWRAMFCAFGCTNITPFMKKRHLIEFWTKAPDPSSDRENLAKLFESGILQKALETNKRGIDGNVRILSIIAENFTYKKLKEKFKIGSDIINSARKHARLNGPGAQA